MQIKITPRTLGGTEFTAQPARLHLGAQNAEGVDRLVFQLPAEWAGCSVTLHIRHSDGTLAAPLVLDAAHSAPVGRSFTGWPAGQWMLAATDGSGYTAYTRPGRYDVYDILPHRRHRGGAQSLGVRTVHRPGIGAGRCGGAGGPEQRRQ